MYKYIVYVTTNKVNNKIYVGIHKTSDPNIFDNYIGEGVYINKPSTYKYGKTKFQKAVLKYGINNFYRKTLQIYDNEEDAAYLESMIVNEDFLQRDDVYNLIPGGGYNFMYSHGKECHQYDLDGNYIQSFDSIISAAKYAKRGATTISRAIHTKINAAGYFWSFDKFDKLDLLNYKQNFQKRVKVYQYDKEGNYTNSYKSIHYAAQCNNVCKASISRAIQLGTLCGDYYYSDIKSDKFSTAKFQHIYTHPVYVYDIYGNFINEFENMDYVRKYYNIKGDIYPFIKLNRPYYRKYQFSFTKYDKMKDKSNPIVQIRKVNQYDLNGNYIKTWDSINSCYKEFATVRTSLKTGVPVKGYIFKYADETTDIV